jgi:hypothetical protein
MARSRRRSTTASQNPRVPEALHNLILTRTASALAASGNQARSTGALASGVAMPRKPSTGMSEFETTVRTLCNERGVSLGRLNTLMGRSKAYIHSVFLNGSSKDPTVLKAIDDALGTRAFAHLYDSVLEAATISGRAPLIEEPAEEAEPTLAPAKTRNPVPQQAPTSTGGDAPNLSVKEIIEQQSTVQLVPTRRMTITPEIAKRFLQNNKTNRPMSTGHVQWFAQQMRDDEWDPNNGETIKFAEDGGLMDGQHRLMGCVLANVDIVADVQFGLPWSSQSTIDVGRKRTIGDQLSIEGEKYGNHVASAVRWVHAIAKGSVAYKTSTPEVQRFIRDNPQIRDSISYVRSQKLTGTIPTLLCAMHYLGAHVLGQPEKADAMVKVFVTGYPAYEGDPLHRVREVFVEARGRGQVIGQARQAAMLIHGWNQFSKGIAIKMLRMPNEIRLEGFDPSKIGVSTQARIPAQTSRLADGTAILEPAA